MRSKPPIFERFIIADCLYHQVLNDEESTAFDQLKAEARNRNPWAVTRLAQLAIEGKSMYYDVKNSVEHGIQMLLPLAERGFAFAQYRLAEAYLMIDQDEKAIDLLERCLKARIPDAAHRLALLYEHQNPKRAEKCLKLAGKWGFNENEFIELSKDNRKSSDRTVSSNRPITDSDFDHEIDSDYVERKPLFWLNRNHWESKSDVQVYKSRNSNG